MMSKIIDFDDPSSFPLSLERWDYGFEKMIREKIKCDEATKGCKIESQLQDLHIGEMSIVTDFISQNPDVEVAVCHATRLLDKNTIMQEGLVTGGRGSVVEERLRTLLEWIGLDQDRIDRIFNKIYNYWNRDQEQRTGSVHFFFDKSLVYKDDIANNYANNLGGEILRWAIRDIDSDLYKIEPYKRLWIEGTPSIVKFKCKLSDVHNCYRAAIIAEIVKYFIVERMYSNQYEFIFTGRTNCSISAENIISIEEIKGFNDMQKQYSEYKDFYD